MKKFIRNLVHRAGYDVFKRNARYNEGFCRKALLGRQKNLTVLDVGANRGQFAHELRECGFKGKIISFEPLSDAHADLQKSSLADSNWIVAERAAIGDEPGEVEINVSGNSVSSSLLPLEQCHLEIAPDSAYIGKETVKVMRLDDAVKPYDSDEAQYYLKADTQGFEKHVIDGAPEILRRSLVVELELSLTATYDGCLLFEEGLHLMKEKGFRFFSTYYVLQDLKTGEMLQTNAFFVRA